MKKINKIFLRIISAFIAIILIIAVITGIAYYRKKISYDQAFTANVTSDISIIRNSRGIPLISAQSKEDMYFALGYIHALDRLPLMEYFKSLSYGNIVKFKGDEAIPLERLIKALDFREKSKKIISETSEKNISYIKAYCNGINSMRKTGIDKSISQKEWLSEDIISILLFREWAQSCSNNTETIFPLPDKTAAEPFQTILPSKFKSFYSKAESQHVEEVLSIIKMLNKYTGTFNRGVACFSGSSGESRHKSFFSMENSTEVYPDLYPVHVNLPSGEIKGFTSAGLPFFFAGKTKNISFYTFTLNTDVQNFIIHRTRKINGIQYYQGSNGWKKFSYRVIQPGKGSTQKEIRLTENGPIFQDLFDKASQPETVVSLSSLLPQKDLIESLFSIPFAKTPNSAYLKIFKDRSLPRSYLFCDNNQAIASYSGRVCYGGNSKRFFKTPYYVKSRPITDLSLNRRWTRKSIITGSSPAESAPYTLKKNSFLDTKRYGKIDQLLKEKTLNNENRIKEILTDTTSPDAETFIPVFLKLLKDNPVTSARLSRLYFHSWNKKMKTSDVAPALFAVLLKTYIHETLDDDLGKMKEHIFLNSHLLHNNFYSILKKKRSKLFDDKSTEKEENYETIFDRSFLKSMRYLNRKYGPIMEKWKWGSICRGNYLIPKSKTSLPGELFESEDRPYSGFSSTVFKARLNKNFKPAELTSLAGYFFGDKSRILTNFSYSVNPMSDFYYGRMKTNGFTRFNRVKKEHLTIITPER